MDRAREVMRQEAARHFEVWDAETPRTDVERARQYVCILLGAVTQLHGHEENTYAKQMLVSAAGTDRMDATISALTRVFVPEMTTVWDDFVRQRYEARVAGRR